MASSEKSQNYFIDFSQYVMVALTIVGTILILSWLLKYSAYGIDFSDESFYLVWISNPFIYDTSLTQFGFVYHPLYVLLSGDIAAVRQANILITFGLAWGLAYTVLVSLAPESREKYVVLHTAAAGLATSALILFDSWLATPNYNSLALQSLLVAGIGLLLAEKSTSRTSIFGWILIGAGGWLAFMAKPSTALALAVCVFVYLLLSRKLSIRLLSIAVASTLLLLLASALLIDGSVFRFIERLRVGVEFANYLGSGHGLNRLLRIDDFELETKTKLAISLVFITLFIAIWSTWAKDRKWLLVGLPIPIAFFALTALLTIGQIHRGAGLGSFQGLLIFGATFAAALAGLLRGGIKALKTITASQWIVACLFLVMPHIYAFGTNRNYWINGSWAAIFWLLAGLILLGPMVRERKSWLPVLPIALAVQAITATLVQTGLEQPQRQIQPLRLNTSALEIGPRKSTLVLSKGYADYIASAVVTAREAGFQPASPVIDMTGQSPGILYAMGAESIGLAWIIGDYPGSLKLAEAALARTSCEKIATAWVLFEPNGPRSIPTQLMPGLGAEFPGGYKQVGTWQTAEGAGGYDARRTQELYKPMKPQETLMACQKLREKVAR